jgi:PKD repeat protein
MVFLLDASGVPSKAQFVELATVTAPPPSGVISSPTSNVTIAAGTAVSFDTSSTAAKYSWIFPGGTPATSTARSPGNVTFATAGEYVASLTLIDAANNADPSPETRTIRVLPADDDFDIAVDPASRTVNPGQSAAFTVTVTPLSGFHGTVTLSVDTEQASRPA